MKKKIVATLASILLVGTSAVGVGMMVATADELSFENANLQAVYNLNDTFNVPKLKATQNGEEYTTQSKIVFPDGSSYASDSFILTQEGVYKIIYYCEVEDDYYQTEETFEVKQSSNGLFTVKNGSVKFGQADISENLYGAQFDGSLGMEVTYNGVIDLSESTKNDMFLEIISTAHESGKPDFSEFYITLTDIYDLENTVQIKIHCAKTDSYSLSYSKAKACDKNWIGGGGAVNPQIGGVVIGHSFGSLNFTEDQSIKLYWDNEDLSIYTMNSRNVVTELADFNEEKYISKLWQGFTTGEAQMSISLGDVTGLPRFVIKSLNGLTFTDEYPTDIVAPSVRVMLPEGELPNAQVGKKFKLFDAEATDNLSVNEFTTKVYYNYSSGNYVELSVLDGAFTPNRAGDYTIVYFAKDATGNIDEEMVTITAYETLDALSVDFEGVETETHQVGEFFAMQNYEVVGGSGMYDVKFYLRNGNEEKEVKHGDLQLLAQGTYTLVCKVSDYIGNVAQDSYVISLANQSKLFMSQSFHLPKAFVGGQAFALPMPESYDYTGGQAVAVKPIITANVGSAAITVSNDGVFTPTATAENKSVSIKYSYTKGTLTGEYTYEVPVVIVQDVDGLAIERYFYGDDFTATPNVNNIQFTTSTPNSTLSFIKPLQAKSFALEFSTDETILNVPYVDFEFTDRIDKNISVLVRMYPSGMMSVNGSKAKAVSNDSNAYTINYDNTTFAFSDRIGANFGVVTTTQKGETFNGFTSDEIYLTIRMGEVSKATNLYISKLNGQVITRGTRDVLPPQVFLNSELGGNKNIGDEATIYAAQAYDVLSVVKTITITVRNTTTGAYVTSKDGVLLRDADATKTYEITISDFGSYLISVVATDGNNRKTTATKTMFVGDAVKPTISVNGKVPTSGEVNVAVVLPNASVSDNVTASDKIVSYVVVYDPNGYGKMCEGGFIPTLKGTYIVRYVAMDENGQFAMVEYKVVVS